MGSIQYIPLGEDGFRCTIVTTAREMTRHIELVLMDVATDTGPLLDGDDDFKTNSALVGNLLNAGISEFAYRSGDHDEARKSFRKAADRYARAAVQLADYTNLGSYQMRKGWCSCCFALTEHRVVDGKFAPAVCLCLECGEATTPCAAAGCRHMARRSHGPVRVPPYCGEHRHEIRSFTGSARKYDSLDAIDDLRTFDKKNLRGITRTVVVAGVGVAVVAPMVFIAAPAIGGALGASGLIGPALSGAAATGHGLAFLGGGTLAAGGLGMAGGTAVVTATGAALGGTLGAVTASAYLRDDKSFSIEKLRGGVGTPVIVASGFLTEGGTGWGAWERIVTARYPDNPVYRVHWGAKELAAFGAVLAGAGGKVAAGAVLKFFGAQGSKQAAKVVPGLGGAMIAADLIANPWHVAKNRAEQTAAVLADLLARVDAPSFILVGHSLGARVMLCTAELLATKGGAPKLQAVHLLGAAVGVGGDWKLLNDSVADKIWNYHSANDGVLKTVYPTAQAGQKAIGRVGFGTKFPNIVDIDMSEEVLSHSGYYEHVVLENPAQDEQRIATT